MARGWSVASQRPRSQRDLASKARERSDEAPPAVAASVVCRSSDSVAPKGDSMQRKSVPLLIKSADDDSGTFTGLASVFDNLDHDGDIVRRGAFSKSLDSGTPIPLDLDAQGR